VTVVALCLLLAQLPTPAPAPNATAPKATAPNARELFAKSKCNVCHGDDGKGDTGKGRELNAPNFADAKFQKETTDKEMAETIENGVKDKAGKLLMPGFKEKLSPAEVRVLVAFVRSFGGGAR
jgi:mono/diheme cytochrome c family protein